MLYVKTVSLEFILFLFVVVHCKEPPKLLRRVKPQYKTLEGQTVKLRCKFSGTRDPLENRTLTAWKKLPEGRYITDKFSRYKIRPGFLKIKKVKLSDHGTYACIAHNPYGKIEREIQLVVKASNSSISKKSDTETTNPIPSTSALSISAKEPPILRTTKRPPRTDEYPPMFKAPSKSNVRFLEYVKGQPIKLKCHATGALPLNVTWLKNDKPLSRADRSHLKQKGLVISIDALTNKDAGTYTCTVRNAFGRIDKTFVVKVVEIQGDDDEEEKKPKILRNVLKNETAMEGVDVTFVCSAIAKNHPDFHLLKWKSSKNVSNGSDTFEFVDFKKSRFQEIREIAKQHMGNRKIYTHRFIVRNVTLADEARYTCVVLNSAGFVSQHVFLTIMTHEEFVNEEGNGGVGRQFTMTKAPRNSPAPQEDKEILVEEVPLAALIGVPIAVLVLLIGTIVWCYFMTRKHHFRQHLKGVDKSPTNNDLGKKESPPQLYATKKEETRNVSFNIYVDYPKDKESPTQQQIKTHLKPCDSPRGKCTIVREPPLDGLIVYSEPPRTHSNRTNHRKRHEREDLEFNESSGSEIKCSGV